ncbi:hypothetical protein ACRAWG_35285 [Methylobacterium sp. P31]
MFKIVSKAAAKSSTQPEIRELNDAELDAVAGGLIPPDQGFADAVKAPIGLVRYLNNHQNNLPPGLESLTSAGHTPPGLDRGPV